MKTRGKTMISFIDKSGRLDEVQLQQDLDSIKEFYQNHGYIDVDVQEVGRERKNGPLVITIGIKEGTLYHVNKLSFTGYKETTEEKIRQVIKTKEGAVYSPKQLHDDAKAIADNYGPGRSPLRQNHKIDISPAAVVIREILVAPGDVFD